MGDHRSKQVWSVVPTDGSRPRTPAVSPSGSPVASAGEGHQIVVRAIADVPSIIRWDADDHVEEHAANAGDGLAATFDAAEPYLVSRFCAGHGWMPVGPRIC